VKLRLSSSKGEYPKKYGRFPFMENEIRISTLRFSVWCIF